MNQVHAVPAAISRLLLPVKKSGENKLIGKAFFIEIVVYILQGGGIGNQVNS